MSSPFDVCVGQHVRRQRLLHGMTQQELAARLGVSFQQVQKYEHGSNKLSFERAYQLCEIFSVPITDWSHAPAVKPQEGDRQALYLLQAFQKIKSSDNRSLVCALANAFAAPRGEPG